MRRGAYIIIGIISLMAVFSCGLYAQNENNNKCCPGNKPCVHITVHKQLDKDGNIESYDSVYTYTYDGNMADTGFMNSIFKRGGMTIQIFANPNGGMPDFMNDPFFQRFDIGVDMDNMQKMMEKEVQELMQNAGMPNMQPYVQPTPPPCAPKNNEKRRNCPSKKCAPKHNVSNGGVQI
jgi:hypothetical protein